MTANARAAETPIVWLPEVDSTNAEALRRASGGTRGPLWIAAERQTAGRGRSGRSWSQAGGNLAASLLFEPQAPVGRLHQLSLLSGVAVHQAIGAAAATPVDDLALKWPNDILLAGAKAGGILVETTTCAGRTVAVAGIGINIATAPVVEGRGSACLAGHGVMVTARDLLGALDGAMRDWLARWRGGDGFDAVRRAWLERGSAAGERMSVHAGSERVEGDFEGIDGDGALLLRLADGTVRRMTFGDVSLLGAPAKGTTK